jgi:valyl-tRNA synthetase
MNRWILSRLGKAVQASRTGIEQFRLDDGSNALYHFFWNELCDWYLELCKPIFAQGAVEEQSETRQTLACVIEMALRALHPYIPFVTEELWQQVPRPAGHPVSIALAAYPKPQEVRGDVSAEGEMNVLMQAIGAARTIRSEHQVHPAAQVPLTLRSDSAEVRTVLNREMAAIKVLVKCDGDPIIEAPGAQRPRGAVMSMAQGIEVLVGLRGHVEPAKEKERIERGLKKTTKDIEVMEKRLQSPAFTEKAPPDVVAQAKADLEALREQRKRLEEALKLIDELKDD